MEESQPILGDGYYGENDWKPLSFGKKVCVVIACIILSPLILLWLILTPIMMCCIEMNDNQKASMKVMTCEAWYRTPGKKLALKRAGSDSTDIDISKEFLDGKGKLQTCAQGISLRKSIEYTIETDLRQGAHGEKIENDKDVDKPRYHLHGWTDPFDPNTDEVWTCQARYCVWPAMYSWSGQLPKGLSWSTFTQEIDLQACPDVLGYLYLIEVSNPKFYDTSRIQRVGATTVNAPDHTHDTEGKVFARYNYSKAYEMGNLPKDGSVPDAYIFKGKVCTDAQLKVLHTYRIMKPQTS